MTRRAFIANLARGLLCGTLALPHAHANCQTHGPDTGNPPEGTLSAAISAPSAASVLLSSGSALQSIRDLPDSPGTVLRRRIQAADNTGASEKTASSSGFAAFPDQFLEPLPSQRTGSLAAANAKASDVRLRNTCPVAPETAGGTVAESSNTSANPATGSAVAGASTPLAAACPPAQNPYQRFLNSTTPIPLTPKQKAYLAVHNFIEPGNLVTILGTSGIAIASDSHTAYGPGWRGFGRNAGISFVQDATGDFFGTFLVPSVAHEDPHYHRLPNASIPMRTLHAISRTVIAQSDSGRPMPNYATLLTYPITAEIANLYVPGVATNGPSTVERVLTGYATDPIDNLITEFLPDVAKRIHVRVIFVQQIINQVAAGQAVTMFP